VYVLLTLAILQTQVQLFAVIVLVLRGVKWGKDIAAAQHAVAELSPADVDALVHLSEHLKAGDVAHAYAHLRHLVQSA
jgi:hypothetical protein